MRAYKKTRKSTRQEDWRRYRTLQRQSQTACHNARNAYVHNMVNEQGSNSKRLYSYVKSMKSDSCGVAPLRKDGQCHSDAQDKAEILNNQFSSVFTLEDKQNIPPLGPSTIPTAEPLHIHKNGVRKLLERLNPNKATGPDKISTRFLKEMATEITSALTFIFQASYDQGQVPDDWKGALVTPIYKKGDKSKASNYRPVSLTSICCKVMEHILHSHIMNFLESKNILTEKQHGFRKRRSCESQLVLTIHDLATGLNNKEQIDAILLDFSKAFDKVPHDRLAAKLHHYGIRNKTLAWIKSFLHGRSQQVVLDGKSSSPAPVTSGVPQGTVLGPLLFLVYINDLPEKVEGTARLFADDCLLYRPITSNEDAVSLQEDLDRLQKWEKDWQMMFNPDKCEVIRITNKRKTINASDTIHGHKLQLTNNAKYLGVTIDSTLSWNTHIDSVTKKSTNTISFLRRNLSTCPKDVKETCYKTLVRPQLEYAATVWDPHTKASINKLEAVQRRAARFCHSDYRRTSSVSLMLQDLGWEDLETRRQNSKVIMMYRIINRLVDIPASPHLIPTGSITRGHAARFLQPHTNINSYKFSFIPSAIRLWNLLPTETVQAPTIDAFKVKIGTCTP